MPATVIDGNAIAAKVRGVWKGRVAELAAQGVVPGLAVVVVGEDPASRIYVGRKIKACGEIGIRSERHAFPAGASQQEVLELIARLNADPAIHGILVQLPLPAQVDMRRVLEAIDPLKDVDGFNLYNVGAL